MNGLLIYINRNFVRNFVISLGTKIVGWELCPVVCCVQLSAAFSCLLCSVVHCVQLSTVISCPLRSAVDCPSSSHFFHVQMLAFLISLLRYHCPLDQMQQPGLGGKGAGNGLKNWFDPSNI